jgi:GNAT superfamily N-acetyltransferase
VTLDVTSDGTWQFWAQLDRVKVGELLVKRMDRPTGWQPTWSGGRWIDWVHVEEPLRRRGIAAAMFAALAERARRSGVRRLAASTRSAAAIRLNERIGMTNRLALRRYVFPSGNPKEK